ncbi:hypothetical protein [Nonomuraea sp. NPDC050786]|uniref:hypothetical protein n=1 Tax=Nonomuraea sp. NPDC050786 TaxID=3154840 RepID=UPI0033DC9729
MRTEEIYCRMEDVSRYLEGARTTMESPSPGESTTAAVRSLVMLGYVRKAGDRTLELTPWFQFKSVAPYRAHMGDSPAGTVNGLRPEPSAGFNPQNLPENLTRPELARLMDWASGQIAMLDQARPQEPPLGNSPAVVTFVRQMDGELYSYAALRAEGGRWIVTSLTVRMTWSDLLDWIESGSSPNHDAIATMRSMDVQPSPL